MISTEELEKQRRKQIGRRHERTFISYYLAAKSAIYDSTLLMMGFGSVNCTSKYIDGCKTNMYNAWTKETESLIIVLDTSHSVMTIHLKEPNK